MQDKGFSSVPVEANLSISMGTASFKTLTKFTQAYPFPSSFVFYFPGYCHRHLRPPACRSTPGNPLQADWRSVHPGNHHYHTRHGRLNIRRTLDREAVESVPVFDTRPREWLWGVRGG